MKSVVGLDGKERTADVWELPNIQFSRRLYKECKREKWGANFFVKQGPNGKLRQSAANFLLSPKTPRKRYPISVPRLIDPKGPKIVL